MSKLSRTWKTWRNLRAEDLVDGGMPREIARGIATREATARQSGESLVGREAAMESDLIIVLKPDGFSIFLNVPERIVPEAYLARARAWAAQPGSPVALH